MIIAILAITAFLVPSTIFSQNFRLNYINTDKFPVIEAGFVATNSDGIKIYNSTIHDFAIAENNQPVKLLEVVNPIQNYQLVSVVIMVDISLSMQGRRINLVKEGLVDFIDQIPLESSEIAIACFSDETYIYTDFTQSRNRLISALNRMQHVNGTNFDGAFLDQSQGALAISSNGRHKKVIIFVSDGLGTTDAERISTLANQMDATVFALNINLPIPHDLRALTQQTGGQWFDRIGSTQQFRSASSTIFKQLQCTDYGTVKWLSRPDCNAVKSVQLNYKKELHEFDYDVPADKVGKIEITPSLLQFGTGRTGLEQVQNLSIISRNIPVTLKSITQDTLSGFRVTDKIPLPLKLNAGEQINTKINYLTKDAGRYSSNLKFSFEECPDIDVKLFAGGDEQIQILFPKGGEVFTIGVDTSILWEGVKRTQPVEIEYRMKENQRWTNINKATNLKYLWNLPKDTSSSVQVRLTPLKPDDENMEVTAVIDGSNTPVLSSFFSPDGTRLITTDKNGFVKTWNPANGKALSSLGGYDAKKAVIADDNERLFLFLKDEVFVWNSVADRLSGRTTKIGKKVSTAMVLPDGSEVLTGGNVSIDPAKNARIWSGIYPFKSFLFNQPEIKWVSFTNDGKLAVTLDSKNTVKIFNADSSKLIQSISFRETITEIIISPDGSRALVKLPQENCMLDLKTCREIYRMPRSQYIQFTPSGTHFIAEQEPKTRSFIESATGKTILKFALPKFYEVSTQSRYVITSRSDTISLYDLHQQRKIFAIGKPAKMVKFDASGSRFYLLTNNNSLEIYSTDAGTFLGMIDGFSRKIRDINIHTAKQFFAFVMEDNRIEIWSPGKKTTLKDAVSGRFTIASPIPEVIDTIQFYEQALNVSREINVQNFAVNKTRYPLSITGMEITGENNSNFAMISRSFPQKMEPTSRLEREFRFTPSSTGTIQAIVKTYTLTDTFSTVIVGKGVQQKYKPLLRHLDFGQVNVGSQKDTLAAVLLNTGADTLIIRNIENSGPDELQFKLLAAQVYRLAPSDTLKARIRFMPSTRGKTTTLLAISPLMDENKIIVRGEGISNREVVVTGITRNSADSIPIQAMVKKYDLGSDRLMEEIQSGTDGRFTFRLAADRNFGITADKPNFISTSFNIDLTNKVPADTIKQDLYLTEIKPGAIIRFNCIFFESDKASLLAVSQPDLKRLLEVILKNPDRYFEIHGHTDSKGSEAYNLNLSKSRATTVLNYLVKNGVPREKLAVKFFGESAPVSTNETEEGRALNRRVELKVVR